MSYVHLHCHSNFSLLDGASRISELVKRAKHMGMPALALTDHGNLFGAVQFYTACKEAGIKPILGYEAYIAPGKRTDRTASGISEASYHLTLLAKNETGWKNLIKLASTAYLDGFYYRPRIDKQILEDCSDGLICLSGCASSEFAQLLIKDKIAEATDLADWFHSVFDDDFYIEIMDNGLDIQAAYRQKAIEIGRELAIPVVATSDTHYVCREDARAQEILVAVNTGKKLSDTGRMKMEGLFHLKDPAEMAFDFDPAHVQESLNIAEKVTLELDLKTKHFPPYYDVGEPDLAKGLLHKFSGEEAMLRDELREKCDEGIRAKYEGGMNCPPGWGIRDIIGRLDHELEIINRMGFASYFLVVADFVAWARNQAIPVSARGSACGSLVAYVLGLSIVDPLVYGLLFERFLDPSRSDPPDIDIDFCKDRRDEVVQYVRNRYGSDRVANIITFGTMAARAALRDVGRVLGVQLSTVNRLVDLVPDELYITLPKALAKVPELAQAKKDPATRELIEMALKLEGTNRQTGVHAAGIVIADKPLTEYVPLAKGKDGIITTQWGMGDLEKVGLLKMDFLGLRNLTVLSMCTALIGKSVSDLENLPLDDPDTWNLIRSGNTSGVFQLDTDSARNVIASMQPESFNDIIAIAALNRPATLGNGMCDEYIEVKHGRRLQTPYPHPAMAPYLNYTYGVMVYQEQVMQILHAVGKMDLARAYACIKAISKKKPEEIKKFRAEFLAGATEISEGEAKEIFAKVQAFGGYGFNKSHSTAYAMIAYQTAWLKAHYPLEFMAALMTTEIDEPDRLESHILNCRKNGIIVERPDVNSGRVEFFVRNGKIVCSLAVVRGVSKRCVCAIASASSKRPFVGVYDFCQRIPKAECNRAALEQLIGAGAFDFLGITRSRLVASIPKAVKLAEKKQRAAKRNDKQGGFGFYADCEISEVYDTTVAEWSRAEKCAKEKHALGFYLSGNPLDEHMAKLKVYRTCCAADLMGEWRKSDVIMGGIIQAVKFCSTKKPSRGGWYKMARFVFQDETGSAPCVIFPDDLEAQSGLVLDDAVCMIIGKIDNSYQKGSVIVERIIPLDKLEDYFVRAVTIKLSKLEWLETEYKLNKARRPSTAVSMKYEEQNGDTYVFSR